MSFSVSVKDTNIEYCGKGINGVFSNRKNILNLKFIKMFFEIINFYKKCRNININKLNKETLGDFLKKENLSEYFINFHNKHNYYNHAELLVDLQILSYKPFYFSELGHLIRYI